MVLSASPSPPMNPQSARPSGFWPGTLGEPCRRNIDQSEAGTEAESKGKKTSDNKCAQESKNVKKERGIGGGQGIFFCTRKRWGTMGR
jgi:hypothetical protein